MIPSVVCSITLNILIDSVSYMKHPVACQPLNKPAIMNKSIFFCCFIFHALNNIVLSNVEAGKILRLFGGEHEIEGKFQSRGSLV